MANGLTVKRSIDIKAPVHKVWEALTKPEMIKQYLFGTTAETDWKPGSPIRFRGSYEGKEYEDKGTVKQVEPGKRLQYTYWSSMAGKEDKPENYATVTYSITPDQDKTIITLTQDNVENEKSKAHLEGNWGRVLNGMKNLLEKGF